MLQDCVPAYKKIGIVIVLYVDVIGILRNLYCLSKINSRCSGATLNDLNQKTHGRERAIIWILHYGDNIFPTGLMKKIITVTLWRSLCLPTLRLCCQYATWRCLFTCRIQSHRGAATAASSSFGWQLAALVVQSRGRWRVPWSSIPCRSAAVTTPGRLFTSQLG